MMPIEKSVFEHLNYVYNLTSTETPDYVSPNYISTIFLFYDEELVGHYDIPAHTLAMLMAVFKKENLVDYSGARDEFYGKPRRYDRKMANREG